MARVLEEMDEAVHYVKNQSLGFTLPYSVNGEDYQYNPDFIARTDDGRGQEDQYNRIIEVTGERKLEKDSKVSTARNLWVPAGNNHGGFERGGFVEVTDPWDAVNTIRGYFKNDLGI